MEKKYLIELWRYIHKSGGSNLSWLMGKRWVINFFLYVSTNYAFSLSYHTDIAQTNIRPFSIYLIDAVLGLCDCTIHPFSNWVESTIRDHHTRSIIIIRFTSFLLLRNIIRQTSLYNKKWLYLSLKTFSIAGAVKWIKIRIFNKKLYNYN